MGDFRHESAADDVLHDVLHDVNILPSNSPDSNSRQIDQNSHANTYIDFSSAASLNAGEMGIRGKEKREGEEEQARTVTYLDRIGRRIVDGRTPAEKMRDNVKEGCAKVRCREVATTFFPPIRWLSSYNWKTDLPKDIMGGITICVLLIPQGIAYAQLASIPPIYGLYTAFFAPILYCLFGTCRQLSFGTMAVITIMTGAIVERVSAIHYVPPNVTTITPITSTFPFPRHMDEGVIRIEGSKSNMQSNSLHNEDPALIALKVSIVASASLLMGLIQLTLGFLRFGYIASLMSEPMTRAFTTGCACYVFSCEIKHFFGIEDPNGIRPNREKGIFGLPWTIYDVFSRMSELNWGSFVIGLCTVSILVFFKSFLSPMIKKHFWNAMPMQIPIDIMVVILGTLLSWGFNFNGKYGVAIVGEIPAGFPSPTIPDPKYFVDMIPDCFVLALVGFAISISLSKIVSKKNEYEIEPNVDLKAYGGSNMIGSLFSCMPCSGCISRTLLLDSLGVKSQIQGLISSCVMLLVLMVLGQYFKWLPNSILAGIIMIAIRKMFLQITDIPKLWRISKADCIIWIVTFLATILLDVPYGLLVGIPFSLLIVIIRALAPPHVRTLGRIQAPKIANAAGISSSSTPSTDGVFEDVRLYANLSEIGGVRVVRLESSLFFGNAEATKDALVAEVAVDIVKVKKRRRRKSEMERKSARKEAEEEESPETGRSADLTSSNGIFHEDSTAILTEEVEEEEKEEISFVIIDCSAVTFTDYVGVMTVGQIVKEYKSVGIRVFLSGCRPTLVDIFRRTEEAGVGDAILFLSIGDALEKCRHYH